LASNANGFAAASATPVNTFSQVVEWYPWFHLFNRCEALLSTGRLREAHELAQQHYHSGLADHSAEARACFALQRAKMQLGRGRIGSAVRCAREALGVFRRIGRPMFLHETTRAGTGTGR
jgi:hypothetical protein